MIQFTRTDASHPDFKALVKALDTYLAVVDGDDHAFYHQYNHIDAIKYALVAYENERAIACGAIKAFSDEAMEVKRMYTAPECRGKGVASKLLRELEAWAAELGYSKCVLETGKRQVEAIGLYHKNHYQIIPNYGQYIGVENSVCFEKKIG